MDREEEVQAAGEPSYRGTWRIADSEAWDRDDLDLLGPAEIHLGHDGLGTLQLLAISGDIDYRVRKHGPRVGVEFSWEGTDDGSPVSGRGTAHVEEDELRGHLWIHRGDDSAFVARRTDVPGTRGRP